jgi:hypothetical protein
VYPISYLSFDVAGMDFSDQAVRSEIQLGSEIQISLSPRKTRKAEEVSMADEDL